jgi:dinuclear metal center YbgI/SA1388 family protein
MKIQQIVTLLDQWAPTTYAEDFDNVGLLVGNPNSICTGILIAHDVLENVVEEAIERGMNLIVGFHPIIFSGLKKLNEKTYVERVVAKAIKNDIALYALHTALDNHQYGVSHALAKNLGLKNIEILVPQSQTLKQLRVYVPKDAAESLLEKLYQAGAGKVGNYAECSFTTTGTGTFKGNADAKPFIGNIENREKVEEAQLNLVFHKHLEQKIFRSLFEHHPYEEIAYEIYPLENLDRSIGMGCIGELDFEIPTKAFLELLSRKLDIQFLRHSTLGKQKIKKVAVLGGSGSFAIPHAINAGADAFVTGDMKYHDFFKTENKILLVDAGHYETERFTKKIIHEYLIEKMPNFAIALAKSKTNPVNYFSDGQKK